MFVAVAIQLLSADSQANGRYPAAQYFALGDGAASQRMAVVTTFGLVVSTDGGRTWGWICEDAIGYSGQFDSTVAITDDGSLVVTVPDGVSRSSGDWCGFERPVTSAMTPAVDVASVGNRVVAAMTPIAEPQFVQLSDSSGARWNRGWSRAEMYAHTIDFAPSAPTRVYLSAWVRGALPAFFRSDDTGATFREMTRDFAGGYIAYIAWVDPLNADVVLLRSDLDPSGANLLRSDDGGATFRSIYRSQTALLGVAASPGARQIWASNSALNERIHRSADGGATFTDVRSTLRPRSLRYVRQTLYATVNEADVGFSFACSRDDGDSFLPVFSLADIQGPERCPMGSPVQSRCADGWEALRTRLLMLNHPPSPARGICESARVDGGVEILDGAVDVTAVDSGTTGDATMVDDHRDVLVSDRDVDAANVLVDSANANARCSCVVVGSANADRASRRQFGPWWTLSVLLLVRKRRMRLRN